MSSGGNIFKSFMQRERSIFTYCAEHSVKLNEVQQKLLDHTIKDVPHSVMLGAPESIQLNMNLMRLIKAKKVLDVGVYTGFSALGAALAIGDDGKVVALDVSDQYADIAKKYWKEAKVEHKIELIIQPALKSLDALISGGESGTFDFAVIDADKTNYTNYYERCLTLLRPGGIIALDNVLWGGSVLDASVQDPGTAALRSVSAHIRDDPRVDSNMLPVGDGLTLAFKL